MGCVYQAENIVNGKSYIKHGLESFRWNVLYQSDDEAELLLIEEAFINRLNTKIPNGYNLTDGGEGMSGHIKSPETREKLRKAGIGRKHSEEVKKKIGAKVSIILVGNTRALGNKLSENTKIKMSEAHKKQVRSQKEIERLRNMDHRLFLGKQHSEITKGKMRESQKRAWAKRKENGTGNISEAQIKILTSPESRRRAVETRRANQILKQGATNAAVN